MHHAVRLGLAFASTLAFFLTTARSSRADTSTDDAVGEESWKLKPAVSLQSLLALRASYGSSSGTGDSLGLGASVSSSGYITFGPLTMRAVGLSAIGKGAQGVEGIYTGDFAVGGIYHVGDGHGPFARLGMRGYMMGNEAVWLSSFEIPTGQAGYQYIKGPWLFEAAGRAGLVVTGRHRLYGTLPSGLDYFEQRKLETSGEWGGHLALGYKYVRAEAEFSRIGISDGIGTPLDVWKGSACVRPGTIGACIDVQTWRADVARVDGSVQPLAVAYGGISIGIWTP